jgi:hypothetical protein
MLANWIDADGELLYPEAVLLWDDPSVIAPVAASAGDGRALLAYAVHDERPGYRADRARARVVAPGPLPLESPCPR